MGSTPPKRRRSRARGFTLIEIVLVLFVFVVVASLAWPMLMNSMPHWQITSAAEEVKSAWVKARVEAMEKNVIIQFYYEQNSGEYWTQTYNPDDYLTRAEDDEQEDLPELTAGETSEASRQKLAYDIKFTDGEQDEDQRAESLEEEEGAGTEPAVWFYPDGRTSTGFITLTHPENLQIKIRIRGVTGVATIGDHESSEGNN